MQLDQVTKTRATALVTWLGWGSACVFSPCLALLQELVTYSKYRSAPQALCTLAPQALCTPPLLIFGT